ncbi:MAG: diguanylate cyclase (GGDEF)-like protein/PAS domain S-box-containing protein [Sulfurimonas sp.]|jgi:diguanylate cyclase (GGDEF)-like protein/PAS domain S-box-containing protein|uniref:diguanylate cyclase domain-containing protein n=1 Tax=Sulfurimonas sp. TaxID=2022749 RepID=UPI0039E46348
MKETHIGFTQSLSARLFRLVFGGYVILAIFVTVIQLLLEYSSIQKTISEDLTSIGKSFNGGVSEAMWEMDEALLKTIAQGIAQSSIITGVKITSNSGEIFAEIGSVPLTALIEPTNFLSHTQFYTSNLQKESVFGIRDIGVMTVYSNRSVAIDRVTYSFFVIFINSLIKTTGLWIIFYLVMTKVLSRPLSQLTNVVSQMEFVAESKEPIPLDYPDKSKQDELSRLIAAMDKMQQRLFTASSALTEANHNLEKKVEERTSNLADSLAFNETVLYSSPIPVGVYSVTGQCVFANDAYASYVGKTKESLLAQNFNDIEAWKQSDVLKDCISALETQKPQKNEASVTSSGGNAVWFEYQVIPTVLKGLPHLLIQFFDLSVHKQMQEELLNFAMHDSLTQLPNRRLLLERMSHAISNSKRHRTYSAILFLDLDEFKWLNDTHGHEIGDILLCEVAQRLLYVVRESDTVARIGGDEFIVLLEDCHSDQKLAKEHADVVLSKIQKTLGDEYNLKDIHHTCSVSIGMTLFMGDEQDSKEILNQADMAMYEAKRKIKLA